MLKQKSPYNKKLLYGKHLTQINVKKTNIRSYRKNQPKGFSSTPLRSKITIENKYHISPSHLSPFRHSYNTQIFMVKHLLKEELIYLYFRPWFIISDTLVSRIHHDL